MSSAIFDRVKELNRLSENLLRSHSESLARKNIHARYQLVKAIELDLDKLTHAMVEVKENRAPSLLRKFAGQSALGIEEICQKLANAHVYHFGFEIHEPLDLVLYGIDHWIRQSNEAPGTNMRVSSFLRFPASPAFQKRVGAFTEIMRIWLEVGDRILMLELFDIHRPADSFLESAPKLTHRNFQGLFRHEDADAHGSRLTSLFAGDAIWHYAFYVRRPSDVISLHTELQSLASGDSRYVMPYAAPIHNLYDNSFHTKIIKDGEDPAMRLEFEFVTDFGTPAADPAPC
jgi:hypothetical protein